MPQETTHYKKKNGQITNQEKKGHTTKNMRNAFNITNEIERYTEKYE